MQTYGPALTWYKDLYYWNPCATRRRICLKDFYLHGLDIPTLQNVTNTLSYYPRLLEIL
jgi:hypothetical protein